MVCLVNENEDNGINNSAVNWDVACPAAKLCNNSNYPPPCKYFV